MTGSVAWSENGERPVFMLIDRWENKGGALRKTKSSSRRGAAKVLQGTTLRRILVPIDFSPESLKTLHFAKLLATRFGARLHLIHVVSPGVIYSPRPVMVPPAFSEEAIAARAWQRMKELLEELSLSARSNPCTVRSGTTVNEINAAARKIDADLIAIGTRGFTGLKRILIGSTTERVVRQAPCPVLVVREKEPKKGARKGRTALQFQKILVPVDFSAASRVGLDYALGFAYEFDARLVVFHSVYVSPFVLGDEYSAQAVPDLITSQQDYAKAEMEKLQRLVSGNGKIETEIGFGAPVEQITDYVAKEEIDLIITSTHGRSGLQRVFIGSTAERVVRHASCPVLVVPNRPARKKTSKAQR